MRARLELPLPIELNTAHGGRGGGPCGNVKLARHGRRRRAGCAYFVHRSAVLVVGMLAVCARPPLLAGAPTPPAPPPRPPAARQPLLSVPPPWHAALPPSPVAPTTLLERTRAFRRRGGRRTVCLVHRPVRLLCCACRRLRVDQRRTQRAGRRLGRPSAAARASCSAMRTLRLGDRRGRLGRSPNGGRCRRVENHLVLITERRSERLVLVTERRSEHLGFSQLHLRGSSQLAPLLPYCSGQLRGRSRLGFSLM
jgi:hypothetical protein